MLYILYSFFLSLLLLSFLPSILLFALLYNLHAVPFLPSFTLSVYFYNSSQNLHSDCVRMFSHISQTKPYNRFEQLFHRWPCTCGTSTSSSEALNIQQHKANMLFLLNNIKHLILFRVNAQRISPLVGEAASFREPLLSATTDAAGFVNCSQSGRWVWGL